MRPLDESLLTEFHARICGDLTPEWAGKWRAVEVTVGPAALEAADRRDLRPLADLWRDRLTHAETHS